MIFLALLGWLVVTKRCPWKTSPKCCLELFKSTLHWAMHLLWAFQWKHSFIYVKLPWWHYSCQNWFHGGRVVIITSGQVLTELWSLYGTKMLAFLWTLTLGQKLRQIPLESALSTPELWGIMQSVVLLRVSWDYTRLDSRGHLLDSRGLPGSLVRLWPSLPAKMFHLAVESSGSLAESRAGV
jgi:hypothetical protein